MFPSHVMDASCNLIWISLINILFVHQKNKVLHIVYTLPTQWFTMVRFAMVLGKGPSRWANEPSLQQQIMAKKKMWQWEIIAFHVADAGSKGLMAIDTIAMACQCTSKAIWPFWNYISSQSFSKASWPSMCQWFSKASWPSMYAICYMAHIYMFRYWYIGVGL